MVAGIVYEFTSVEDVRMSIFKIGMKVIIRVDDDPFDGELGTIRGERGKGENREFKIEFPEIGQTWYRYDEIKPAIMVELAPPAQPPQPTPATASGAEAVAERLENYRAIFSDVISGHLSSTPMVMAEHGLFVLRQYDIERFAHQVNAERGNDFEAQIEALQSQLAQAQRERDAAVAIANDYRDQIWSHQGTLRILKAWLGKADSFGIEDGFTEASILGMVTRDLEASEKMDTRTLPAVDSEG